MLKNGDIDNIDGDNYDVSMFFFLFSADAVCRQNVDDYGDDENDKHEVQNCGDGF
jgi:hypothetical protein